MSIPLLTSKLYIPPPRPNRVPRPRLLDRLNAGLVGKLTLISAPAGFGKTTLLSEWVNSHQVETTLPSSNIPAFGWLSLDRGDNDLVRFLSYLITMLQKANSQEDTVCPVGAGLLDIIQSPQPPALEMVLTPLINDIAGISRPLVVVLDDYHLITNPQVDDALRMIVEQQPPTLHIVIATRADPLWPLACLRARQELTELRVNDLRFTPDEIAAFLNHAMGLALSGDEITHLENRTEGWIAGLQMAALALQSPLSAGVRKEASEFIRAFSGSHRYIFDYLMEEILAQQSSQVTTFLLRTSILERLCGSLCDAVLGGHEPASNAHPHSTPSTDIIAHLIPERPSSLSTPLPGITSQAMLEYLDRSNLFVLSLDDERRWYRYHNLFVALLRSRLELSYAAEVPGLHIRASEWNEKNGYISEAVVHALAANDVDRVIRLIESHAFAVMDLGGVSILLGWLDALPANVVQARPWLSIARGWGLAYLGKLEPIEQALRDAENAIDASQAAAYGTSRPDGNPMPDGCTNQNRLLGYIAAIRALAAELKVDVAEGLAQARRALELLPKDDLRPRAFVAYHMANLLSLRGDVAQAVENLENASVTSLAAGDVQMAVMAQCEIAGTFLHQGKLKQAASLFQHALRVAEGNKGPGEKQLLAVGIAYLQISALYREWNELPRALEEARRGIELCRSWGYTDYLFLGLTIYAGILRSKADYDGALEAINEAREITSGLSPNAALRIGAHEVPIHLARGDLPAAWNWAQACHLNADDVPDFARRNEYLAFTRILIAREQFEDALKVLTHLAELATRVGASMLLIRVLVLQAIALEALERQEAALATLAHALELAEPEGYLRTFIEEGAPIRRLLVNLAARSVSRGYVPKLLLAFEQAENPPHQTKAAPLIPTAPEEDLSSVTIHPQYAASRATPLIEPLSRRETELLQWLAAGLSNIEIARKLVIADETVKKHLKNIYGKLDVHSRTAAVAKARQVGIL